MSKVSTDAKPHFVRELVASAALTLRQTLELTVGLGVLLLLPVHLSAAQINFNTTSELPIHVLRGAPACGEAFADPGQMTTAQIVEFQAQLMANQRSDFNKDFISSRVDVAYDVWKNSVYAYSLQPNGELASSIGLTFSNYDSTSKSHDKLPEENSLHVDLERPTAVNGKGFIVEIRTYGMLHEYRREAFPGLLRKTLELLESQLEKLPPSFRDEKIVHTYGGREGRLMYQAMGFEVIDPEPTLVYGKPMWRLRASPNTIALRVGHVLNLTDVSKVPVSIPLKMGQDGLPLQLEAGGAATLRFRAGGRTSVSHFSGAAEKTELPGGAVAAPGKEVWVGKGFPNWVEELAEPFQFAPGLTAAKGTSIAYMRAYNLGQFASLAEPAQAGARFRAKKGTRLEFTLDLKTFYVFNTEHAVTLPSGKSVPEGSAVKVSIHEDGSESYELFDPENFAAGF